MSVEHKVLGFRPPPGSLAAAAQAAAARRPEGGAAEESGTADEPDHVVNAKSAPPAVDAQKLRDAAREDAQRILSVPGAHDVSALLTIVDSQGRADAAAIVNHPVQVPQ